MEILTKTTHSLLHKSAVIATVNERLVDAVINSREIKIGTLTIRCLQCHLGPGLYSTEGSPGIHQHGEVQIEIPLSGTFNFTVENSRGPLSPAQALVIPALELHNWETKGGFMMGIQISVKDQYGNEVDLPYANGRARLTASNPAITSHVRQLVDLAVSKRSSVFTAVQTSSLMMVLIAEVLDAVCRFPKTEVSEDASPIRGNLIFERASAFIKSNLGMSLHGRELALQTGISSRHLTRIFLKKSGRTPHEYILRLRLEGAQKMIDDDPETPIKLIAYECGFSSASHFTWAFKKSLGISPSVYAMRKVVRS